MERNRILGMWHIYIDFFEYIAVEPRLGLKYPVTVNDEGVVLALKIKCRYGPVQGRHIYRCPEYAECAFFRQFFFYSNGEMGDLPIAHEYIAHINSPDGHCIEPVLVGIYLSLKIVGARICELHAVGIYQSQVYEFSEFPLEFYEDIVEIFVVGQ